MTRTFQINTLFAGLTVLESVVLAVCERKGRAGIWHRTVASQREEADEAYALLEMLRLAPEADTLTRNLPYGKQRLVEIALALATKPGILLLDEPMEGLAPIIVQELMNVIRELVADGGMAVIVVEQHAKLALALTRQAVVLERGRVVHRSASEKLLADPDTLHRLVSVS